MSESSAKFTSKKEQSKYKEQTISEKVEFLRQDNRRFMDGCQVSAMSISSAYYVKELSIIASAGVI